MSAHENGRAATEVTTPPVTVGERASALPTAYPEDSRLRALREADTNATDGYVIAEVPGDVAVPQSYQFRWHDHLGRGEVPHA